MRWWKRFTDYLSGKTTTVAVTPVPAPAPVPVAVQPPAVSGSWQIIPNTDFESKWGATVTVDRIHLNPKAATSIETIPGASGPMPKETYSGLAVLKYDLPAGTKCRISGKFIKQTRVNLKPMAWECFWWCCYFVDLTRNGVFDKLMAYFAYKALSVEAGVASSSVTQGFIGDQIYKGLRPGDSFVIECQVIGQVATNIVNGETVKQTATTPAFPVGAARVAAYSEDAEIDVYKVERWVQ